MVEMRMIIEIPRRRTDQKLVLRCRWRSVRSQRWESKAKKLLKGLRWTFLKTMRMKVLRIAIIMPI